MNTERSDRFVREWQSKTNPLKQATFTAQRTFPTSREKLFRLLCPATEYDWLPNFSCEMLHSDSGYAEYGAVFRTNFFGMDEVFVCTRYEPNKAIDYCRASPDVSAKLDISLIDHRDGTVTGIWTVTVSALNERGNQVAEQLKEAEREFGPIMDALEHYVNTGEMIS